MDQLEAVFYQSPMSLHAASATEETGATPVESPGAFAITNAPSKTFLIAAQRALTEEEAASPAGLRWLSYNLDRLEAECSQLADRLQAMQEKYDALKDTNSDQRVDLEKLRGSAHVSVRNELLSYLCFSIGSAGLGVTPSLIAQQVIEGTMLLVISAVLLIGGVVLRVWK